MKIGIVTEYYYPSLGGIQEHIYHFACEARALGHDVTIITSNVRDQPPLQDAEVIDLPTRHLGRSIPLSFNGSVARVTIGTNLADQLQRIFEREKFDVIHLHSPPVPTLPLLGLLRSRTVTVGTFHSNFRRSAFYTLFHKPCQAYLDRLDGCIAVSPTVVAAMTRYFQCDFRVIPNGVDTIQFNPAVPAASEFADGMSNILWIGRMEPRCGLEHMLHAFFRVAAGRPQTRLIVVGDGPLRHRYERMVPTCFARRVIFTGSILAARPTLYACAQIVCVTPMIASFSITLLEAMASGKPVIAADIGGLRSVMVHKREGLFADTADAHAFSAALLTLLDNRDLAHHLGAAGLRTAATYAWPSITRTIIDYYDEAAKCRRGRPCRCA